MRRGFRGIRLYGPFIAAIVAVLVLAACGSSSGSGASGNAQSMLKQTFSSSHSVKSGVLGFDLTVNPTGSSTLSTPITFSVSGPFQSRGKRQAAAIGPDARHQRAGQEGLARRDFDRNRRLRQPRGRQLSASGGRLPEAPVEFLLHVEDRLAGRGTRAAGDQPPALADPSVDRGHRDGRGRLDHPYPGRRQRHRVDRRSEHVPGQERRRRPAPRGSRPRSPRRPSRRSPLRSRTRPSMCGRARAMPRCAS